MDDRKKGELAMLVRVDQHFKDHPLVPPNAQATLHIAEVANAKDAMLASGGLQDQANGEFRMAVLDRYTVIKELRRQMREIAETAKSLSRTGVYPGLEAQFRMPGHTMQELRDRAQAFVDAAEPLAQAFIDRDSAATFVADLEAAIADFDTVTGKRYAGLGKRIGATANLTATARAGITAVRALDSIMIKRYRNNPALLAEWKAAQRIAQWPSQTTGSETPSTTPSDGGSGTSATSVTQPGGA
jgi:hypothetical protein